MIYQLLELSQDQECTLESALQESEGEVLFFIHPFQLEMTAPQKTLDKLPFKIISKFIELFKQEEELPPVIIFEDVRLYDWTTKIMEVFLEKKDRLVLLVPTPPTFAMPAYSKPPVSKRAENRYCLRYEDTYWQRFLDYIGWAGVKKVFLGGTSLELYRLTKKDLDDPRLPLYQPYYEQRKSKGARNTNYVPARCVGTAAVWLSTMFDVELTNFTLPHNRADLLYIESLEPAPVT